MGVRPLRTPRRAPQANAYCERLIGTTRRECLDFLIPLSEEHLCRLLTEWRDYYNRARLHSSLGPDLPTPCVELPMKPDQHRHQLPAQRAVASRPVLGGSITITGCHASPDGPSFSRGTKRSFSSTLLRRWPGNDRVQNLHRGSSQAGSLSQALQKRAIETTELDTRQLHRKVCGHSARTRLRAG